MTGPASVLVAGAGSAGRRHLRNLRALLPDARLACWRMSEPASDPELATLADAVVFSAEEALAFSPGAAIVAGPATTHARVAIALAAHGVPLLIEKPLSHSLREADLIADAVAASGTVALVGYMLRFHPLLATLRAELERGTIGRVLSVDAEVGQSITEWRPAKPYQSTVSARADLGGGVLLELSHEFDYLAWLLGPVSRVGALTATLSGLELDVADCAAVAVRFSSGALGTISLDLVRRPMRRGCRIHGENGTFELDLVGQTLRLGRAGAAWSTVEERPGFDRNDMFLSEMRHFLACIAGVERPAITIGDGRHALAVADAAARSAQEGRFIDV